MEGSAAALHVRGVVLPEAEHRDLYVVAGRVSYEPTTTATTIGEGWMAPGLVDAHCHVGLDRHGAVDQQTQEAQASADRDAGTLLIRDAGSPADTRWIDDRADLPRLIRAGRHLARTRRYLPNYGLELEPDALPTAATEQAKWGDGWVKIVGDWIERDRGDLAPCWPDDTVRAAIDAAHAAGARVTTHVFGEEAVRQFLDAGVDCIEHGTGLDDELIDFMAERGIGLVPTLINIDSFPAIAESATSKFPRYADHMRALHAGSRDVVRWAYEAGVPIYTGTDAGGSLKHGLIAAEISALHEAGLSPTAALGAGCWRAREWLGRPHQLDEGSPADFVVYPSDPRADLGCLTAPTRIVLRGRVVH
jgi:imidazolonepropionase-like amidohydrolase